MVEALATSRLTTRFGSCPLFDTSGCLQQAERSSSIHGHPDFVCANAQRIPNSWLRTSNSAAVSGLIQAAFFLASLFRRLSVAGRVEVGKLCYLEVHEPTVRPTDEAYPAELAHTIEP